MSDTIKVVRVLTYIGPREWVTKTLERSYVQGSITMPNGAVIQEVRHDPEIVGDREDE